MDRPQTEWVLRGYQVFRMGFHEAVAALEHPPDETSPLEIVTRTRDLLKALEHMKVLTTPATRHLLFQLDQCTFLLSNGHGTDCGWARELTRRLGTPVAHIVDQRRVVWTNGQDREVMEYEACIFELFDAAGDRVRSVACLDDGGRWVYETWGVPHPVEASFPASATRVKDRFTTAQLRSLAEAYGLQWLDAARLESAPELVVMRDRFVSPAATCSIEEANDPAYGYYARGMGYVPFMETHADSVIADLERAVRLNPAYAPRVERHLVAARHIVRGRTAGGMFRRWFRRGWER